eukprot:1183539-Prorocentrum_minimum.AAC.3
MVMGLAAAGPCGDTKTVRTAQRHFFNDHGCGFRRDSTLFWEAARFYLTVSVASKTRSLQVRFGSRRLVFHTLE